MRWWIFLCSITTAATLLIGCNKLNAQKPIDLDILALITKTRITQTTYSLFSWNRINPPNGEIIEEWSAEFNSGNFHRVETPRNRIIANCQAMTGTMIDLDTGKLNSGKSIANAACGINANIEILSAKKIGRIKTEFGIADGIEIVDAYQIRTYHISKNGILLAATIYGKQQDRPIFLKNWATHVDNALPSDNVFSKASLYKSFVPKRWQQSSSAN
jgi:hypothetical protein